MSKLLKSLISQKTIGAGNLSFLAPSDAIFTLHGHRVTQLFSQANLVSDDQTGHLNAQLQDSNLINPWGIAFGPNTPFWG